MTRALILLWLASLLTPEMAHAYIDPNAGGALFQLLAPLLTALVGCWMLLRRFISAFFSNLYKKLLKQLRQ